MAFIGNTNTTQAFTPAVDYFSGNGSTTAFTLSRPVASVAQVQVVVNNVAQNPSSAFTVSGNTITFTSAPSSGTNNIYVYYTSPITQVIAPGQGTVGTTQLQNGLTVNFADGTAAAPSITNDGDTNTGVFYPAADTVGVSTGGSERVRVDSSGNVGIGTSSPTSSLNLIDALSGGQLLVATNQTNATEKYGTFGTQHYTNAEEPALGVAVQSNVTDNNILIGGALGEFNAATQVRFYTAANNTTVTGTERMRIDSNGNVGIGTATPTALRTVNLEVSSSATNDSAALIVNKRGTGIATARLATVGGANGFDINYNFPNSGMLSFYDLAAATTRVAIDSSGNFQFNSGYGSTATAYGCRAWVNFNGTGTVAIRASGNVSSITDNGTGDYTVNFTTAMPDANYNAVSMGQRNDFNNGDMNISFYGNVYGTAIGTGSVRVNSAHASSYTLSDALTVCVAIFR